MARHKKSGNAGGRIQFVASLVGDVGNLIPRVAQTFDTVGSVIGFRRWARQVGVKAFFRTREKLWKKQVLPLVNSDEDLLIAEFGVAFGEAARWWLSRVKSPQLKYHGFDLFTGLPSDWRNLPAGAFDAGGQVPELDDARARWHVGDASQTVNDVDWESFGGMKFINFDLDLFKPSLDVWQRISPTLRSGDILYFDEAFDADERVLINAVVLLEKQVEFLGASPFGLALRIL